MSNLRNSASSLFVPLESYLTPDGDLALDAVQADQPSGPVKTRLSEHPFRKGNALTEVGSDDAEAYGMDETSAGDAAGGVTPEQLGLFGRTANSFRTMTDGGIAPVMIPPEDAAPNTILTDEPETPDGAGHGTELFRDKVYQGQGFYADARAYSRGTYEMSEDEIHFQVSPIERDSGKYHREFYTKVVGNDQDNVIEGFGTLTWNGMGDKAVYTHNDILLGGGGNDILYGYAGDDWLEGGTGNDVLYGDTGKDTLLGGEGDDELHGGWGDDLLYGGQGNDVLRGGLGIDKLYGGEGDDWLYSGNVTDANGHNELTGGSGSDVFVIGDNNTPPPQGNDNNGWDAFMSDQVWNLANAMGSFVPGPGKGLTKLFFGMAKSLSEMGGDEAGEFKQQNNAIKVMDFNPVEDTIVIPLSDTNIDHITTQYQGLNSAEAFRIYDESSGTPRNIAIIYWDDLREFFPPSLDWNNPVIREAFARQILNEALYMNKDGVRKGSGERFENDGSLDDLGTDNFLVLGNYGGIEKYGLATADYMFGTNSNDILGGYRPGTQDGIESKAGDDTIYGFGGDDLIFAGSGFNHIYGGDGSDTIAYYDASAGVKVDMNKKDGRDYFEVNGVEYDGKTDERWRDYVYEVENVIGSNYDDILIGDGQDNILNGGAGNDELRGGGGNDTIVSGSGDDVMYGGAGADTFRIDGGQNTIEDWQAHDDGIIIDGNVYDLAGNSQVGFDYSDPTQVRIYNLLTGETIVDVKTDGQPFDESKVTIDWGLGHLDRIKDAAGGTPTYYSHGNHHGTDGSDWMVTGYGSIDLNGGGGDDYMVIDSQPHLYKKLMGGDGDDILVENVIGFHQMVGDVGDDMLVVNSRQANIHTKSDLAMHGGAGADTFVFLNTGSLNTAIHDFSAEEGDRILIDLGVFSASSLDNVDIAEVTDGGYTYYRMDIFRDDGWFYSYDIHSSSSIEEIEASIDIWSQEMANAYQF
ncbi:MAG: calcium-binding protein [Pseudomonadota bacterium]